VPAAIVSRLSQEVASALRQPDVAARTAALGLDLAGTTPDAFAAFLRAETAKWGEVIRTAKI
jgi:tripartite-type tricarboxylate transporter receptor subunit TctC